MNDIKLITPPDRVYTSEFTFLLIYPSSMVKEQFQQLLANTTIPINVYLYESEDDIHETEWLLDAFHQSDITIIDIDNSESRIRDLASYFISKEKTYWLTNSSDSLYNVLSKNRIFDLDFLQHKIGGQFV